MGRCIAALLAIFCALGNDPAQARPEAVSAATLEEQVEILRDPQGVAHVFAPTDEGVFYGAGYAAAEDRLLQMDYARRVVQGRLAEVLGARALNSDRLMRTLGLYQHAQEVIHRLDEDVRRLLEAYAAGVNRFMADFRPDLSLRFSPFGALPEPWTAADCIAVWMRLAFFFEKGWATKVTALRNFEQLVAQVGQEEAVRQSLGRILDESAAIVSQEEFEAATGLSFPPVSAAGAPAMAGGIEEPGPRMSHNWAVSGQRTTTGRAVLHSDPQISVTSPPLWYEIHLSGKTYRVRGLGVAGCPGILIGWNDHVAWGVTALGSDPNDLYRLTLDPSSADRYRYEGRTLEMETRQETLRVKEGEPIPLTVRRTHLGPVVTPFLTAGLLPGEEYALRYQVLEDRHVHTVQGLMKMMRARDWESFKQGLQDYRSPGIHVLYADAQGNIGYHTAGAIPIRPKAAPLGARLPHDGSSSAFAIRETIRSEMLPQMFNPGSGAIATANNLPVGAWYPFDLAIGTGGGGDTIRSWRLRELLAQKETVEPAEVRGFHNDCVNPAARELVRLGLHAGQSQGFPFAPEAAQALEVLQNWNGTALATQPPAPLVHHIADNLVPRFRRNPLTRLFGGGESGVVFWLKTRKTDLERNPGLELDADELNYIQAVLSEAWNQTVARSGRDPSRWLDRFHTTLGLPYQQTLENFGSLDPSRDYVSPPMECIMVSTIWSQWGNSYSQFVDFGDGSASLLPPGLSELADSAFFQNQIPLWAAGQLAPAPLEEQAIRETAVSRKTLTWTFDPFSVRVPRFPFVDTRGARFTGIALSSATPREIGARLTWYGNAGEPLAGPNLRNPAIVRCPLIGKQSCAWWALPCSGAPAAC